MAAIELRDVRKTFRIPHERHTTLTERVLHAFRPVQYERFEALRGIDLTIERGTFVGLIGRNGSGKSTLLKLIAGLLPPDQGRVHVQGTMSALLELGLGFSQELTVWENVELYAAVLGYPRREIQRRIQAAVDFADLERFRDAKLKNLSTGMRARLGFATALQAESDILLLDEILAVGDESFQRKCLDVFLDLKARCKTIVLVTHALGQVEQLCDYAYYLDEGRIAAEGLPELVTARYLASLGNGTVPVPAAAPATSPDEPPVGEHVDTGRIRFLPAWLETPDGRRLEGVAPGDRVVLVACAEVHDDIEEPIFGLIVNEHGGKIMSVTSSCWLDRATGAMRFGQTIELRLPFDAPLREGTYVANLIATSTDKTVLLGKTGDYLLFAVSGTLTARNAVELQTGFSCRVLSGESPEDAWPPGERVAERGGAR